MIEEKNNNNNVNDDHNNNNGDDQGVKTFTQEQVNAIVGKRLAEAKASRESELGQRETELNQREMQIRAKEMLEEKGLPKELAQILKYTDEESLTAAIDVLVRTRGYTKEKAPEYKPIGSGRLPEGEHSQPDNFRRAMGLK